MSEGYQPVPSPAQAASDLRDDGFHPEATILERLTEALEWIAFNACTTSRRECKRRARAALDNHD
jgi:hypothetical protein